MTRSRLKTLAFFLVFTSALAPTGGVRRAQDAKTTGPVNLQTAAAGTAATALWTKALSGEPAGPPVVWRDRVYVAGTDRTVTCLSGDGAFLWSRPVRGRMLPLLAVSSAGAVYAVTEPGTITAFNPDGSLLWALKGTEAPILPPREGRDGRVFLIYRSTIRCVSPTGAVKWSLGVEFTPSLPVSETDDGDLLVASTDGPVWRISPWGEALERISMDGTVTALLPVPGGFAAGYSSGLVRAYDVRAGRQGRMRQDSDAVWQFPGPASCSALSSGEGTLLALFADGRLAALNPTDGSTLWSGSLGRSVPPGAAAFFDYGQFNILFPGFAAARSPSGTTASHVTFPVHTGLPALSDAGIVFTASADWVLHAYRAETRIRTEKIAKTARNYGILNRTAADYALSAVSDQTEVRAFFAEVSDSIMAANVGAREPYYARRLAWILRNDSEGTLFGRAFDETERARAAILLGQLGSAEYRDALIASAYEGFDATRAIGILYGLSACGSESDGQTLAAVRHLVRAAGIGRDEVLRSACDTLYALIRYSAGSTALDGTRFLAEFLETPYSAPVQNYARQVLGNILH